MNSFLGGAFRAEARTDIPSYTRTFGVLPEPLPLMEYNYDRGKTNPNQIEDGYYMACRGYTLADIAGDIDDAVYDHKGTYDRLSAYEGHSIEKGGMIMDALNFGCVEGLLQLHETTEAEAKKHIRGKPFYVDKVPGYDWFDSHCLALRKAKIPISCGTIWFFEWMNPPDNGILTSNFVFDGTWDSEMGHNYKISGEKTINGEPTLCVKAWLGRWFYMNRKTFNKAFDIYGTGSWIQPKFSPKDVLYVKLTIFQRILQLVSRYISTSVAKKFPQFYL